MPGSTYCQKLFIFVFIFCLFLGTSCSKKNGPTIGFMLPHMNTKRYTIERDEFTKKVKELGGDVVFMSADNDEIKQIQQVNEILQKDIDILVLDPVNRFRAADMVRSAHDKGIPVISYDRLVANCDIDAFITFDANAIGSKMTTYAINKVPHGKYLILNGDKLDINAVLINEAIQKTLAPSVASGNIEIVYQSFIEKYAADEAAYELGKYFDLSMEFPDVILCAGDMLAQGAISAIHNYAIDKKIVITGQDAAVCACKEILNGNQTMTIYKPVKKMAHMTAEIAVNLSKGKKTNTFFKNKIFNGMIEVPAIFLDVIVVDASNLRNTVLAEGFITEAELAGK
jgi:D-xylose transport system substrate-binding protein